jgi:hypothetical protein
MRNRLKKIRPEPGWGFLSNRTKGYELKDIHPGGDGTTFAVQREKSLFVCVAQDPFTRMDIPAQQRTYCLELSEKK